MGCKRRNRESEKEVQEGEEYKGSKGREDREWNNYLEI